MTIQLADLSDGATLRVPKFCVLRAGNQSPEVFHALSTEEAQTRLQTEVRRGQTPVVYLYQLVSAEKFQPSSTTLSVDDLLLQADSDDSSPTAL